MIKYILFIFYSLVCLVCQYVTLLIFVDIPFNPLYFDFIPPILLTVAAWLFLIQKTRIAGIIGLIGVSVTARSTLIKWFDLPSCAEEHLVFSVIFSAFTTFILFFLGFIAIRSILNPDNRFLEIKYYPKESTATLLGVIPLIATVIYILTRIIIRF